MIAIPEPSKRKLSGSGTGDRGFGLNSIERPLESKPGANETVGSTVTA
jgi:hypothetical protein